MFIRNKYIRYITSDIAKRKGISLGEHIGIAFSHSWTCGKDIQSLLSENTKKTLQCKHHWRDCKSLCHWGDQRKASKNVKHISVVLTNSFKMEGFTVEIGLELGRGVMIFSLGSWSEVLYSYMGSRVVKERSWTVKIGSWIAEVGLWLLWSRWLR